MKTTTRKSSRKSSIIKSLFIWASVAVVAATYIGAVTAAFVCVGPLTGLAVSTGSAMLLTMVDQIGK